MTLPLASKVVKEQPLGGTDDEWIVIEPVHRAVELAEDLHDDRQDSALLFGRFAFTVRYKWTATGSTPLRDTVSGWLPSRRGRSI
ncbi:hypothetical protein ACFWDI_12080 [Streptomyces sp. NPDC060064]|uniref:hypothetical protein n=1 Tax=Streptomyces sp. NPDC060064 TaxID=3347049 RepID=UPI00368A82F1